MAKKKTTKAAQPDKSLPVPTHLQFLIMNIIGASDARPGQAIRNGLAEYGEARNGPAFYQAMRRLEEKGWVEGEYTSTVLEATADRRGQHIREKAYRLTDFGKSLHNETLDFYGQRRKVT